jgi:hypothetical protein
MFMFRRVESWDWSGAGTARRVQRGLARARWGSDTLQCALSHGFSRNQVLDAMRAHVEASETGISTLVAFDFPFSFPYAQKGNLLLAGGLSWWDFATTVHGVLEPAGGRASAFYGEPNHYGQGGHADHFAHLYRGAGFVGPQYVLAHRQTEVNAAALGDHAASVFRLVNPMVGVQSLAGMWMLQTLLRHCKCERRPLTIWPLGRLDRNGNWHIGTTAWDWNDPGVVIVECYPRVSFSRAGIATQAARRDFSNAAASVTAAKSTLGTPPGAVTNHVVPDGHDERDALMVLLHLLSPSWYQAQVRPDLPIGSLHLHGNIGLVQPPTLPPIAPQVPELLRSIEGNIFGV